MSVIDKRKTFVINEKDEEEQTSLNTIENDPLNKVPPDWTLAFKHSVNFLFEFKI